MAYRDSIKPWLVDENLWGNFVEIRIVDCVAIFSGYLEIKDTSSKPCPGVNALLSTGLKLPQQVSLTAPCSSSRGGCLRKAVRKSTGRALLVWDEEGRITLNVGAGSQVVFPAKIFFGGLFVVLPFYAPRQPPMPPSTFGDDLAQNTTPEPLHNLEQQFELLEDAPPFNQNVPPKYTVRGHMVYLSGHQGETGTRYPAKLVKLPEELRPQPTQNLHYVARCGGLECLKICVAESGFIQASNSYYSQDDMVKGTMAFDGILYSTHPGTPLFLDAEDDCDSEDEWGLDVDESPLTYRLIGKHMYFIQGRLDLAKSGWKPGTAVGQLPHAPRVPETFELCGHRMDISTSGHIYFQELDKVGVVHFNVCVYLPKEASQTEVTAGSFNAANLNMPRPLPRSNINSLQSQMDPNLSKMHSMEDREEYNRIKEFFHQYSTTGSDITHPCLAGSYKNPFTKTGKWHFPDIEMVQDELCRHMAWLYVRGVDCYTVERQTDKFPFIEDLDIQAYARWDSLGGLDYTLHYGSGFTLPPDHLIMIPPELSDNPGRFMEERALCVHKCYPKIKQLQVLVYQASGYNKGKKLLKSSYHLVWADIIVDKHSAPRIREKTLQHFVDIATSGYWAEFALMLRIAHPSNTFDMVFDKTTVTDKNGLRMPFNDKAKCDRVKYPGCSRPKITGVTREERPQLPVGILEFKFEGEGNEAKVTRSKWIGDKYTHSIQNWIRISSCRRPLFTDITATQIS